MLKQARETGRTYADRWNEAGVEGRRELLRSACGTMRLSTGQPETALSRDLARRVDQAYFGNVSAPAPKGLRRSCWRADLRQRERLR
ncbi:MAG: hypothetical protein WKF73_06525 [Nocardioidaceae bacterium]